MAIADGALFRYDSLDDIRQQVISVNEDELVLRFKQSALGRPILRKCTKADGATNDPMPKAVFIAVFKSTLINAGYFWNPSIHAIRRILGQKIDSESLCLSARPLGPGIEASCSWRISSTANIRISQLTLTLRTVYPGRALTTPDTQ